MKFNLNIDSINYIKIYYECDNCTKSTIKAAIKWSGEREILACARLEEGLFIKTPQEVKLSFVCDNGLYQTTTQLKYIENKDPYVYFAFEIPQDLEYHQNREYFRIKMDEQVLLNTNKTIVPCKIFDISASGVKLELKEEIQSLIENVTIDMLFSPKSVKVNAKFIRVDKEDDILKYSFSFINLSKTDMDIISQKCIQKQLEYKRNFLK